MMPIRGHSRIASVARRVTKVRSANAPSGMYVLYQRF